MEVGKECFNGMVSWCTNCDITGAEQQITTSSLEECQERCMEDSRCKSIDYANNKAGVCFLNFDQGEEYVKNPNYDGWFKKKDCSGVGCPDETAGNFDEGCKQNPSDPNCSMDKCEYPPVERQRRPNQEHCQHTPNPSCEECAKWNDGRDRIAHPAGGYYQQPYECAYSKTLDICRMYEWASVYTNEDLDGECPTVSYGGKPAAQSKPDPEQESEPEPEQEDGCGMVPLCTKCDITGVEQHITTSSLEECKEKCMNNDRCKGIDYANNKPGICFLNFDQGTAHVTNPNYDAWTRKTDCEENEPAPEEAATCEAESYLAMGYTCTQLEGAGWDMSACTCPEEPVCPQQAYVDQGYTCDQLLAAGWDMTGCQCEEVCTYVCQQYLDQGFSCQECEMAGLKCTPCDECGACPCGKYIDQGYTCDQIEAAGLDCSNCGDMCDLPEEEPLTCSDTCKEWMVHYNCDQMREFGFDCTPCGCEEKCNDTCKEYLAQGQTCEVMAAHGIDCSPCDCSPKCSDTCKTSLEHFSCETLQAQHGLDCSACDCTPKCFDVCKTYLGQGLTCNKLMTEGIDCSACDACSCSQCGAYLTNYSCETLKNTYGFDCGDCVQCT